MGCRVSKFDNAAGGGEASQWRQLCLVHRKNDPAVVDNILLSKPLPEGGEVEDKAKGGVLKKVNSDEKGGIQRRSLANHQKEEILEDDGSYIPQSLSFRVYCISSLSEDDNGKGGGNAENMTDKQDRDVENNKGSNTRLGRRAKIGKGIKTILRA